MKCTAEPVGYFRQIGISGNKRGRQQDMITVFAVNRTAHGIDHQSVFKRRLFKLCMRAFCRVQRLFCVFVFNQLESTKRPKPEKREKILEYVSKDLQGKFYLNNCVLVGSRYYDITIC